MPRIPIDTLKQIQQNQSLSISIVGSSKTATLEEPSVSRDTRSKQSTLEKHIATKIQTAVNDPKKIVKAPVPEKVSSSQNRLTPSETKSTHVATTKQCTFYESNSSVQSKTNQLPQSLSENKIFNTQPRTNSMSTENKSPANATRIVQNVSTASDCKGQNIPSRLLASQSPRNVQNVNMLVEKANSQKATQHRGASITPRTPVSESKTQMAQSRVPQNHPVRFEGNSTLQGNRSSSNVNILPEKNSSRIATAVESKGPAARMSKELLDGKTQANTSGRMVTSIPETVTTNNQTRVNKNISNNFIENRTNSIQRNIVMITPDGSINKVTPLRQADLKGQKVLNTPSVSVQESKSQGAEGMAKSFTPKYVIADQTHEIGVKREAIKRSVTSTPVAKKKCVTRSPAGRKTGINLNLCEEIPANEQQHFINNLKNRPAGLSITPINSKSSRVANPNSSASSVNTSSKIDTGHSDPIIEEPPDEDSNPMYCSKCKIFVACGSQWCPTCNNKLSSPSPSDYKLQPMEQPYVVTQNVTTNVTVSKRIIFNHHDLIQQGNRSFHIQKNVVIKTGSVVQTSPRSKGRPKKRPKEPVCLTLSSDEEEPTQEFNSYQEETTSNINIFPLESEGSKSDQSGPELREDEENEESDDEFPGVTDIHPKMHLEDEEEEEEEFDEEQDERELMAMEEDCEEEEEEGLSGHEEGEEEEEEEVPPEDEDEDMLQENEISDAPEQVMKCRSIRIGSYKVHPSRTSHIHVFLDPTCISFCAPTVKEPCIIINVMLKTADITRILVHFGRCLPIVFVYTTAAFGESLRKALRMVEGETPYFDPTSIDERQEKITLLIDQITDDHRRFLREVFPGDQKVKEIDQKTANEILVKSTPQQQQSIPLKPEPSPECQTRSMAALQQQQMTIKAVPPKPVTKILTYPPPPQTGGIPITSEDLACLNEGEFLNDAIIDFHLKYVFYEKLSDCYREKTHIFSSYFYPRLTSKTDKQKGEEKPVQVRRHSQVKTWTRHIDIFSKDFIIIPINQNVHWFLAIICYPGRVPDAPPPSANEEANKPSDNVTSTNDQDEGNKSINKDQNSSADGIGQNNDENSMHSSNNSLYEGEESPDSEEPLPEAPDSSTHPDVAQQSQRRKETPCICIFDSLSGPNRWKIAATLREYLEMEWRMKKGTRKVFDRNTMQGCVIKCPQQTNYSDCGVYLLQYVESFFENPIPYFGNPMPDLSNWFLESKIIKKRQEIKDLILNLQKKQSPSSAS